MRWPVLIFALACSGSDEKGQIVEETDLPAQDSTPIVETDPPDDTPPVDTVTDTPVVDPASTMTASGRMICANPTARTTEGRFRRIVTEYLAPTAYHLESGNSAVGDLDGDHMPDIVIVGQTEILIYFQHGPLQDTVPVQVVYEPWVSDVAGLYGATLADYDADGDLDIMVTGRGVPDHLLQNDGYGMFLDQTEAAGLSKPDGHHSTGASFADIDGDLDLDLFIAGHGYVDETLESPSLFGPGDPSRLYTNDGHGVFTDVSSRIPQELHDGYTFLGGWLDADDDGDLDLYMVNDFGANKRPSSLAWNDGGFFRADNNAVGADAAFAGMGLALGDLDGDGDEDLSVPGWKTGALYIREGDLWFESSQLLGYTPRPPRTVGWGSEFVDADNDGRMDLTTAYGKLNTRFGNDNVLRQPDAMYIQQPDGMLAERSALGGFDDDAPNRSMTPADINRDGWLDFVKVGLDGRVRWYFSNCGEETFLQVELREPAPNTFAVGATIRLYKDDRQWMRVLRAGGTGYGSGQPLEAHFGLGDVTELDRMVVEWPDGLVETWENVTTSQHILIER